MKPSPVTIQPIGNELAIKWSDGSESFLALESLRKHCPCAGCGGEPDVMGRVLKPEVTHTPASFRLRGFQMVGGYAMQPTWEDGHNSGLYSYEYLKRLDAAAAQPKP
jgi:DUF971 family protein